MREALKDLDRQIKYFKEATTQLSSLVDILHKQNEVLMTHAQTGADFNDSINTRVTNLLTRTEETVQK